MARVTTLKYRFQPKGGARFSECPALEWSSSLFAARLDDDVLVVALNQPFDDEVAACAAFEVYLQSWRIAAGIDRAGTDDFDLVYDGAEYEVEDVEPRGGPTPQRSKSFSISGAITSASPSIAGRGTVTERCYPKPNSGFTASALVVSMWTRWLAYKSGREPLSTMAYAVFTIALDEWHDDRTMARVLGISTGVLSHLRYLSSCVGTIETARKAPIKETRAHTWAEEEWMRRVVLALIRRAGEAAAGQSNFPQLTQADFGG